MPTTTPLDREIEVAGSLARAAGARIMQHFRGDLEVEMKGAEEPVTLADREAHRLITFGLAEAFPEDAILSEEGAGLTEGRSGRMWVVDPLDGTSDFIRKLEGFSVLIGLVAEGHPILGAIHEPLRDRLYLGHSGREAWCEEGGRRTTLRVTGEARPDRLRLMTSNSHRNERIAAIAAALDVAAEIRLGSVGLKVARIAEGTADLYAHLSKGTKLWDSAAPQALLEAAGGKLTNPRGGPLVYDPMEVHHREGLLASNGAAHEAVLDRLQAAGLLPPGGG